MWKASVQKFRSRCMLAARQLDNDCPTVIPPSTVATPVNLQTLPSLPYRMLPDSCQFELLDVDALQDPASGRLLHLYSLVARCLSCETVFKAEEGQGLVSHSAARVVRCPTGCGQQAFKPSLLRAWRPQAIAQA
jgi:hypothetical protein